MLQKKTEKNQPAEHEVSNFIWSDKNTSLAFEIRVFDIRMICCFERVCVSNIHVAAITKMQGVEKCMSCARNRSCNT